MVFQKQLEFGFNGYRAPEISLVPKSAKGKRTARRKVDENQMYAFDLLAAVAGKILMDREGSFGSSDSDGLSDKIKKELLDEGKQYKDEAFDRASCNESPKQSDFTLKVDPKSSPSSDLYEKVVKKMSSEEPMVLDVKPPTLASSDSSVEVPLCPYYDHRDDPSMRHTDTMKINRVGDDDDNLPSCTMKAHRVRRLRKLLASKHRNAIPVMPRNGEFSYTDVQLRSISRSRKFCCTRQRPPSGSFKRRTVLKRCSVSPFVAGAGWEGGCNVSDKDMEAEASKSRTVHQEANDASASAQSSSYEADDYRVKLSIKSFKVPELFIEIPETATVGLLKRTVMEAVTAIIGGGLHIGVLLQGKKVRDDNKTLYQAGISRDNKIDCVGFTLEPNQKALPALASAQLVSPEVPPQLPRDAPQPLARIPPPSPVRKPGASSTVPEAPLASPLVSNPESAVVESNSRALVPVPSVNAESLSVVPLRNSRRTEIVQRRIRRPFSVAEVEALVQAVERLGTGRWRDVKLQAFDTAKHRTYVDLKDKWKTLVHTARISPQQRRGEPVPQELLDRVLAAHARWSQQQAKPPLAEPCLLH